MGAADLMGRDNLHDDAAPSSPGRLGRMTQLQQRRSAVLHDQEIWEIRSGKLGVCCSGG